MAIDSLSGIHAELFVKRVQVHRKIKIGVDAGGGIFCRGHHVYASRNAQPALLAVESGDAIAVREMHDGNAFIGGLGVDVDWEVLAAKGCERAFLYAAGDFLQGIRATNGGEVFVEELLCWRKDGFGLTDFGLRRLALRFLCRDDRRRYRLC